MKNNTDNKRGSLLRRLTTKTLCALAALFIFMAILNAPCFAKEGGDASKAYLIGPEDVLEVSVWKNEELSKVVIVRPDGMISLPLIGDLQAAGYTPNKLRDTITTELKKYQKTVVVSVIVQEINSYRIFILGQVINPGTYLLKRKTSLLQAIALAGGFNQFASRNKVVLIRERTGDDNAKQEKIRFRFDDTVKAGKKGDKNPVLRPGDTIFVP